MSVTATVYIPEGIIMAADSRITGSRIQNLNGETTIERYTLSDNGQKVFLLHKRTIGITACGDVEVNGQIMADFIRTFEIEQVKGEESVKDIAEALRAYIYCKGREKNILCAVAGYDGDAQAVFEVTKDHVSQLNGSDRKYGANWQGDTGHLTDLINGSKGMYMNWSFMYLHDGIELAEFMIDVNCKAQRFNEGVATCGGPIDILLLTKDEGRWIRHKILNP